MIYTTDEAKARTVIQINTQYDTAPILSTAEIDLLLEMAGSLADDGVTVEYTVANMNRVVSRGWDWKAGKAAGQFEVGVGAGKNFKLNQVYEHCLQMAHLWETGAKSIIGSVDVDDGTGKPGTYASIGRVSLTSVMNTKGY